MADIQNQLQKTALNQLSANKERTKELIKSLEEEYDFSGCSNWTELKVLIGAEEPAPPEEEKAPAPEEKQPVEETVESLVDDNSREQLVDLASDLEVEVSSGDTKTEIAEAIVAARKKKENA